MFNSFNKSYPERNICRELQTTYNANILNDISVLKQAVFFNESQKNKNKKKGNITLMKLIYNHYREKKPVVDRITGPFSLSLQYSKKYNKNIYIFGEQHDLKNPCPIKRCIEGDMIKKETGECVDPSMENINFLNPDKAMKMSDYILNLAKTTDVFIDFYIEFPLYPSQENFDNIKIKKNKEKSELRTIASELENCLDFNKKFSEYCELTRFHNIDVRRETNLNSFLFNFCLEGLTQPEKLLIYIAENPNIFQNMFENLSSNASNYIINHIFSWKSVRKELKRSYLGDKIEQFAVNTIKNESEKYIIINKIALELNPKTLNTKLQEKKERKPIFIEAVQLLSNALIHVLSIIVDVYTLARIFKRFNVKSSSNQPTEPRNIIVYAGDGHSNHQRNFLKLNGFVKIANISENSQKEAVLDKISCLNMRKFPQPFFLPN
jgi:hypothetical protein